jgi:hypothetical protein
MSIISYCLIGLSISIGILIYERQVQSKDEITTDDIAFFLACVFGWSFLVIGFIADAIFTKLFPRDKTLFRLRK